MYTRLLDAKEIDWAAYEGNLMWGVCYAGRTHCGFVAWSNPQDCYVLKRYAATDISTLYLIKIYMEEVPEKLAKFAESYAHTHNERN